MSVTNIKDKLSGTELKDRLSKPSAKYNIFAVLTFTPAIIFLMAMFVIPFLFTVNLSFHDANLIQNNEWIGLQNYQEVIQNDDFRNAVWIGVYFAFGGVIIQLILGLALALLINRPFKGSSVARIFAIFPYLIPPVIVMTAWHWMFNPSYGVVNLLLVEMGMIDQPISFFSDVELAMPMAIIASSWKYTSFAVIILLARLQLIDNSLYGQAKIDGASRFQMFRDITLPNLRGAIFLIILLRTIWLFNQFEILWLLTRGGPFNLSSNIPIYIFKIAFLRGQLGTGSSAAIILFVFLVIGASVYFRLFKPSQEVEASAR